MDLYFRNEIFKDLPQINAFYLNESQTGGENVHCPFGSKTLRKAKMNIFSSSKNDYCPQLFNKHLEFKKKFLGKN